VPIYEYKCDECDHRLEKLQKISDEPAKTCPECGEDGLRKLVSAAAFKLKGTGWYETDFKDKKPKTDGKTNTPSKKTEGNSAASTDKPVKTEKKASTSSTSNKSD
jgi:putative FmdB family regulatory protein